MKKYLTVFAVLALGGCAHAEYQAGFLDEYADYSCAALRSEFSHARHQAILQRMTSKGCSGWNTDPRA